jgi:hypothetical protein
VFSSVLEEVKPDVLVLRDNELAIIKNAGKLVMYEEKYACCHEVEPIEGPFPFHVLFRLK